jgi:hypothetical protein
MILPERHAALGRRHKGTPAEEERRRHDVELQALLARQSEAADDIRRFHVAERQHHQRDVGSDALDPYALWVACARLRRSPDREHDYILVENLIVLEVVQQRRRRRSGICGQEHRGPADAARRRDRKSLQQLCEAGVTPCAVE